MGLRIRSTQDAHIVFHAVARGLFPMTRKRLDDEGRRAIRSGNIYVWEEADSQEVAKYGGIERWTDGRRWSPSRVQGEFLLYHQRDSEEKGRSKEQENNQLIKQTYAVFVDRFNGRRKWHLTAYHTPSTLAQLRTVDDFPQLSGVIPPDGIYTSRRASKSRSIPVSGSSGARGDIFPGNMNMPFCPAISGNYDSVKLPNDQQHGAHPPFPLSLKLPGEISDAHLLTRSPRDGINTPSSQAILDSAKSLSIPPSPRSSREFSEGGGIRILEDLK
ncbi:hypothetical protein SCHPADRAFT_961121 [Schizopora paradoxa]|uniref:cAMP-independent regulatory protein pac2 n=1 Tax=Schizopora paradoxa TaxID=27342 RepID=A0A0H2RVX0_9AGAM|nr:hypothetical protein SCHPADRAFT_961121 [Schizopora paradoxa]